MTAPPWLREALTDHCGAYDGCRILAPVVILTALALSAYTVVGLEKPFDIQSFGVGMAALFAGVGGYAWSDAKAGQTAAQGVAERPG